MFARAGEARFIEGEHEVLRWWQEQRVFARLLAKNAGGPKWSFLDGPITANNPMGVHHAWGRTYKDAYQRYRAMTGHELRYQNGFDCQGLWVEVEVEKEMGLGTKTAIAEHGIDRFVRACKKRVLTFAARQTEQSVRLGYWMEWDDPDELRKLAAAMQDTGGQRSEVSGQEAGDRSQAPAGGRSTLNPQPSTTYITARGQTVTGTAEDITARLGNPEWGGSYFTFSTENNETIWTFLKKCFERGKIYLGHDVMPWGGRAGSAYSQMEVADGRKLTTHRSCFVRFPIVEKVDGRSSMVDGEDPSAVDQPSTINPQPKEYLLVWTTTPWTLTSNVAAAVNPDLEYVRVKAQIRGDDAPAYYYFAKDNLEYKRLEREYKEGFGRPEWQWPDGLGKLKSIAQIFKEQGGYEIDGVVKGADMVGWRYAGPFDDLEAQRTRGGHHEQKNQLVELLESRWFREPGAGREYSRSQIDTLTELRDSSISAEEWRKFLDECLFHLAGLMTAADSVEIVHNNDALHKIATFEQLDYAVRDLGMKIADSDLWQELISITSGDLQSSPSKEDLRRTKLLVKSQFNRLHDDLGGLPARTGAECHSVLDGDRDSKGQPNVISGEGTGIVHIAPGCGDVDYRVGLKKARVFIAPLKEDGTFGEGFGPFTGREAIAPETAELVFEELKRKGHLVYVETYPHIYPHCWRTGEELVFRLVDEWFINMDWRDEIKEVTKAINWLPDSIQGQERELEWLTTMRDWMISKKRFWGLALPIWVNPDDATDFKVVGSLAELKELATNGGEGWDEFEGHTPHRPWIDVVKIPSDKHPGQLLTRVEDVGNPWLDAGITPFSTMNYRAWKESGDQGTGGRGQESVTLNPQPSTLNWNDWYPADFVTECFPGQFRNWFYSLLALSTMMRYEQSPQEAFRAFLEGRDKRLTRERSIIVEEVFSSDEPFDAEQLVERLQHRRDGVQVSRSTVYRSIEQLEEAGLIQIETPQTDKPLYKQNERALLLSAEEKVPFKCLLGHRLVMDEQGNPMHKSDGTAIWFEEAAEQLGVDTLRWLYLAQNPASDLRFGTRHKNEPVTLDTPEGPISQTKEGLPTCKVTSGPADEVRRQVLIPLWNSYAFFVNYAVADQFDPTLPPIPLADRPEIDRWILSRLQELTGVAHESFQAYDVARFMKSAEAYIDDLSNWYIRRNRRRFWRKRVESGELRVESGESASGWELDKLAAYQTLHEVLLTLAKLLAPCIPFLAERMYQNLASPQASPRRQSGDRGESPSAVETSSAVNQRSTSHGADAPRSPDVPESVHLCDYPTVDESKLDPALNRMTASVQTLVRLGHRLREAAEQRVRQPLAELRFAASDPEQAAALQQSAEIIADELNVKLVTRADNLDDLVSYTFKPNLKTLGPRYGKLLGAIRKELPEMDAALLAPLRNGKPVTVTLGGEEVTLEPDDVLVSTEQASEWASGDDAGIQVALSTVLTPELIREGMARDFVRHIQQARKDADLDITDRITIDYAATGQAATALAEWSDYIKAETLADELTEAASIPGGRAVKVGDETVTFRIARVSG